MKWYKKIFLKIINPPLAFLLSILGNRGLLPTVEDVRDKISKFGGGKDGPKDVIPSLHSLIQYTQVNNICTAASTMLGLSEQIGVRLSIKSCMMKMVKDGQVSGDGFSHQRAPLNVTVKDGVVLYEDDPDENNKGWGNFSKWNPDIYPDKAINFKELGIDIKYERLRNEKAIAEAIAAGYKINFASKWYSDSNRPKAPNFFLKFTGMLIGGHAYRVVGSRNHGEDFMKMGTFGESWADKGRAWLRTLFGRNFYKAWIVTFDGEPTPKAQVLLPHFLRQHEEKLVKYENDARCYVIQNGKKHHVSGGDDMKTFFALKESLGLTYVKQYLLDETPEGKPYPLNK